MTDDGALLGAAAQLPGWRVGLVGGVAIVANYEQPQLWR